MLPLRTPDDDWNTVLYMKVGACFERAPDALVIERAQQLIAADFRPGASVVKSTAQVIDFLSLQIGGRDEEVFAVMLLDKRRRFIGYEELFRGTVDTARMEVRTVLACVVRSRASFVICVVSRAGLDEGAVVVPASKPRYRAGELQLRRKGRPKKIAGCAVGTAAGGTSLSQLTPIPRS
jgi:hypothetical protein